LFASKDEIVQRFQLSDVPLVDARYNIAPTHDDRCRPGHRYRAGVPVAPLGIESFLVK
jgi:hypothetical protein